MKVLTPDVIDLNDIPQSVDLFLAGGITNCPDWQADAIKMLDDGSDIVVANPRRDRLLDHEGEDAAYQIRWEYEFLRRARMILFWFPKESVCPITLFELGKEIGRGSCLLVGAHPEYVRRFDVVTQMNCYDPGVVVYRELSDVVSASWRALKSLE